MHRLKIAVALAVLLSSLSIGIHRSSALAADEPPVILEHSDLQNSQPLEPETSPSLSPTDTHDTQPALHHSQEAEGHHTRGRALAAAGDFVGAIAAFREALRLQPDLVHARLSLGSALYLIGDIESAAEAYRAVIRLQPDLAPAHVNLATTLMVKHEWADAREELQVALSLQPDLVQAHYNLGIVRYTMGDRSGARAAIFPGGPGRT